MIFTTLSSWEECDLQYEIPSSNLVSRLMGENRICLGSSDREYTFSVSRDCFRMQIRRTLLF